MTPFDIAVRFVLNNEKGINTNPKDPGGITNFGISLRFLKNMDKEILKNYLIFDEPTEQIIINLTEEQAIKLYYGEFWLNAPFDRINNQTVCNYVFDMAINLGISPAIKAVQRACWSACDNRKFLEEDGILGETTLGCLNGNAKVFSALKSERAGDYRVIVATHPEQKEFINGWLTRAYE